MLTNGRCCCGHLRLVRPNWFEVRWSGQRHAADNANHLATQKLYLCPRLPARSWSEPRA
jgi:hypothetical protein